MAGNIDRLMEFVATIAPASENSHLLASGRLSGTVESRHDIDITVEDSRMCLLDMRKPLSSFDYILSLIWPLF